MSSLPLLPVPELKQTLDKYLKTITPWLSDEHMVQTKQSIEQFLEPNGIGATLQKRLLQRMATANSLPESHQLKYADETENDTNDGTGSMESLIGASELL